MKNLYVFGNEHLEDDKLARKVAEHVNGINIVHCRSPDDLLSAEDEEILILDVVREVDKPIVITDPKQIKTRNLMSLHDFDIGFFLNLLQELGMQKNIRIIGIPAKGESETIAREVEACI